MSAVDVHAVASGKVDGPAIVLSNSLGSDLRMWEPQLPALEERFHVIRYDTRGHGQSPVPDGPYTLDDLSDDLLALLNRFDVEQAHLIGLSLGGMTMMRTAVRAHERVASLAVLCTSAALPDAGYADRAGLVRREGTGHIAESVVGKWFTPTYLAENPAQKKFYEAMVADTPDEGYAGCCEAIAAMDLRDELSRISARTLVVAGAEDVATPPAMLTDIADRIDGSTLTVLPDACHLANLQQPEAATAALINHLEQA